jgi:Tfp pilus assembly protein PilX
MSIVRKSQDGFVLLTALMVLALLTMLGIAGLRLAQVDIMIAGNCRLMKKAFYHSEAAVELGQVISKDVYKDQKTNNYDFINNPSIWQVTFEDSGQVMDNNGNLISLGLNQAPSMVFEGTIKMKVDSAGEVMCFGDHDNDITTPPTTFWNNMSLNPNKRPYFIVTGTGWAPKKSTVGKSEQVVQTLLCPITEFELPNTALYVNGNLIGNGNPQSLLGEGLPTNWTPCGAQDIIGTNPSVHNFTGNDGVCSMTPCQTGSPDIIDDAPPFPSQELFDNLEPYSIPITGGSFTFGNDEDIIYSYTGNLTINNLNGYGTIIVDGDLTLGGGISWNGLILATGNFTGNGGGNEYIHGSLIVGGDVTLNGNPDIYYDCDRITRLFERHKIYKRASWCQLHS